MTYTVKFRESALKEWGKLGYALPASSPVRTPFLPAVVRSFALRPAAPPLYRQLVPRLGLVVTAPGSPRR